MRKKGRDSNSVYMFVDINKIIWFFHVIYEAVDAYAFTKCKAGFHLDVVLFTVFRPLFKIFFLIILILIAKTIIL